MDKIKWGPRLPTGLLKKLYRQDALGIQDGVLCEEVGLYLLNRCRTLILVYRKEVECPVCKKILKVPPEGTIFCTTDGCNWTISKKEYGEGVKNHYAYPGRAGAAYLKYFENYPTTKTYQEKIILIDTLIHSFHIDEKTNEPKKSIASKLLEGSKDGIIKFLDELFSENTDSNKEWREMMRNTIHGAKLK